MGKPVTLSLDEFKSCYSFAQGTWAVEYNDRTHLPEDTYVSFGRVKIEECTPRGDAFFWFHPRRRESLANSGTAQQSFGMDQEHELSISEAWERGSVPGQRDNWRAADVIFDSLSESMVRVGLLQPDLEIDHHEFINRRRFAIIVLDTSALRYGAVRYLKEQFQDIQIWVIIPIASLMEIGERIAYITSKDREGLKAQNYNLIRVRPQVTIAPQEVIWVKENFPTETLELAPELLRTFRGYEHDKVVDRISINDRLIIEGIKDLRRQRGISEGLYLMSGDKDMLRLARLEGIHTIYIGRPALPHAIYSTRYSLTAHTFIICSIHRFLWDLTHVFSRVRARCLEGPQKGRVLELFYYFPTKLVSDWIDDKLEVTDLGSSSAANII